MVYSSVVSSLIVLSAGKSSPVVLCTVALCPVVLCRVVPRRVLLIPVLSILAGPSFVCFIHTVCTLIRV